MTVCPLPLFKQFKHSMGIRWREKQTSCVEIIADIVFNNKIVPPQFLLFILYLPFI